MWERLSFNTVLCCVLLHYLCVGLSRSLVWWILHPQRGGSEGAGTQGELASCSKCQLNVRDATAGVTLVQGRPCFCLHLVSSLCESDKSDRSDKSESWGLSAGWPGGLSAHRSPQASPRGWAGGCFWCPAGAGRGEQPASPGSWRPESTLTVGKFLFTAVLRLRVRCLNPKHSWRSFSSWDGNSFFSLVSGCVSGTFISPTAHILIMATETPFLVRTKPFSSFKEAEINPYKAGNAACHFTAGKWRDIFQREMCPVLPVWNLSYLQVQLLEDSVSILILNFYQGCCWQI